MKPTHLPTGTALLAALVLHACSLLPGTADETTLLARVGNRELRESAVAELVPAGTAPEDSVALLRDYVLRWARDASVGNEAAASVGEDRNIERLVEDYRLGLQRQRFEEEVLAGAVDTAVTAEEYERLYAELTVAAPHQLVRALVMKVPEGHPRMADVERVWRANTGEEVTPELRQIGAEVATLALLDAARWYEAPELRLLLPGVEEDIPSGSRVIVHEGHRYFVRVFEGVRRDQRAPLAYLEPRLRKLILEQRRAKYLDAYINKVYSEAQARNEVTIYVGNGQ